MVFLKYLYNSNTYACQIFIYKFKIIITYWSLKFKFMYDRVTNLITYSHLNKLQTYNYKIM